MRSEADARAAVVSAARAMAAEGLVVASLGNVSLRDGERVLITPSGVPYERMLPEDVVALDLGGRVLAGAHAPSSERRVHLEIYARRPDVRAVVHTHSTHATAWSFLGEDLPADTEELQLFAGGSVPTASYAPSGSPELARAAAEGLGERRAVLLARHGTVAVGATLDDALTTSLILERQAQRALLVRAARRA